MRPLLILPGWSATVFRAGWLQTISSSRRSPRWWARRWRSTSRRATAPRAGTPPTRSPLPTWGADRRLPVRGAAGSSGWGRVGLVATGVASRPRSVRRACCSRSAPPRSICAVRASRWRHSSTGWRSASGLTFALVRTGCFLAGCDYGLPTAHAWNVRFPARQPGGDRSHASGVRPRRGASSLPVHPTPAL